MKPKTKKIILITIASLIGLALVALLVFYIWFSSLFSVYHDKQYNFSMKYPKSWNKVVAPQAGAAVAFVSPKETAMDIFQENVNIAVQDMPDSISTAKALAEQATVQMTAVFKDVKVAQHREVKFGGRSGYLVLFTISEPKPAAILNVFTVKSAERAYIFTFMSMVNRYRDYWPLVQEMIRSFRVK